MLRIPETAWRSLTALAYPVDCAVCEAPLSPDDAALPFCDACQDAITAVEPACPRCAIGVSPMRKPGSACGDCRKHKPRFERAWRLGVYDGPLRDLVLRLKEQKEPWLGRAVGELFWRKRGEEFASEGVTLVAPTPLFWWRRLWRGASFPEDFAELLAEKLHAKFAPGALARARNTGFQGPLTPAERKSNVHGAFEARRSLLGETVLLVDDVLTTGATASEMARVCKQAGARRVLVAAAARAR